MRSTRTVHGPSPEAALATSESAFSGTITWSGSADVSPVVLRRTRRWPSVATTVAPSLSTLKSTPIMAGRRASREAAKAVLSMARLTSAAVVSTVCAPSRLGSAG